MTKIKINIKYIQQSPLFKQGIFEHLVFIHLAQVLFYLSTPWPFKRQEYQNFARDTITNLTAKYKQDENNLPYIREKQLC